MSVVNDEMGATRDEMADEMARLIGDPAYLLDWELFMAGGEVWHNYIVHGIVPISYGA